MVDRVHRELGDADIARIASTYHAWRGDKSAAKYADVAGFCKSATVGDIAGHGFVLTPGRYVGAQEVEPDEAPFHERFPGMLALLEQCFAESRSLEQAIRVQLRTILSPSPNEEKQ